MARQNIPVKEMMDARTMRGGSYNSTGPDELQMLPEASHYTTPGPTAAQRGIEANTDRRGQNGTTILTPEAVPPSSIREFNGVEQSMEQG